jgi:hypothetical protein
MNQKAILALIAIIATVGTLIVASSIATPSALALKIIVREKDTRSNPNSNEIRSSQEIDKRGSGGDHPNF